MTAKKPLFIGLDGEAIGDNYMLLQSSDGRTITAERGGRLTTLQCLSFIAGLPARYPRRKYNLKIIWFGSGYDVNHIIRDIPAEQLSALWTTGECEYAGFGIRWFPGKMFWIRQPGGRWVITYDVFGFCQRSFTATLEQYGLIGAADLDFMAAMKALRGQFTWDMLPELVRYNTLEVQKLSELGAAIAGLHARANIPLRSFHGAGASAAGLLTARGVKQLMNPVPALFEPAVRTAYFGGRVCLYRQGRFDSVWSYDINSAYPAAAAVLPLLSAGRWARQPYDNQPLNDYAIYRISFDFRHTRDHVVYPLPVRLPNRRITYPVAGRGWYWGIELRATCRYFPGGIQIEEVIIPPWDYSVRPFDFIPVVYSRRLEYKKDGDGRHIVLKLGLNALYGKLAQSARRAGQRRPAYHNLAYAGLITASTRAAINLAIGRAGRNVIAIATDGIVSGRPLYIPAGQELGQWTGERYSRAQFIQPGLYWYYSGDSLHVKSRGLLPAELTANMAGIVGALAAGEIEYHYPSRRFQGLGVSLRSGGVDGRWLQWVEAGRAVNLQSDHWRPCLFSDMAPRPDEQWAVKSRGMFYPIISPVPSLAYKPRHEWDETSARPGGPTSWLDQPELME